ncbi:MAG: radical SAM protein [Planctomycetota bacterium]|nr:radical SAM protein [Planctomycetota bacterium]
MSGLRVREDELLEMGMTLPGLKRRADALSELPALGLLTLAGMTPEPWSCSLHETSRATKQAVEEIIATHPTLVAVSALTASVLDAYQLSRALNAGGVPTVIGGLHATACPDDAIQHCTAAVAGEGEPVWHQVLGDVRGGQLGGIYRPTRPFDLCQAPVPRFDLLGERRRPRFLLQTERGCPFACEFCGASRLLGPFREKSIEKIGDELAALRQFDSSPWLELADDNTFANRSDVDQLLDLLRQANVRYFTESDWRLGERPEVLKGLAASGCRQVLVGIESMVFRYPGMGAKQAELDRMMDAVSAVQEAGVVVNGCFIVGADGETDESLDRLVAFILESPLAEVQITLQTPFPGTMLYNRLVQQGRLIEDRDWSHFTLFDVTYRPDAMTVEQLEAGFRRVLRAVFSPAASERRSQLRKSIWHQAGERI